MYRRKSYGKRKSYKKRAASGYSRRMVALPHLTKAVDLQIQATATAPSVAAITLSTTATTLLLNAIQNGSGSTQRIGSKINLAGVQLKLAVEPINNSVKINERWRFLIVYDKQPAGSPVLADITGTRLFDASSGTLNDFTMQPLNPDNRDRFIVLYDKVVSPRYVTWSAGPAPPGSNLVGDNQYMFINKFVKIPSLPTIYGANGSPTPQVSDIKTGSLYLITYGNQVAGNASQQMTGYIRTYFHDDPY